MEIKNRKVLGCYKAGYVVYTEDWHTGSDVTKMRSAYNMRGDYIGSLMAAHRLCQKRGILPEKRTPSSSACSIGYSVKDGKWYGWSHRAIFGFKIGSTCKKGHCHYTPKKGEWVAKSMSEAREMAMDFAEGVS